MRFGGRPKRPPGSDPTVDGSTLRQQGRGGVAPLKPPAGVGPSGAAGERAGVGFNRSCDRPSMIRRPCWCRPCCCRPCWCPCRWWWCPNCRTRRRTSWLTARLITPNSEDSADEKCTDGPNYPHADKPGQQGVFQRGNATTVIPTGCPQTRSRTQQTFLLTSGTSTVVHPDHRPPRTDRADRMDLPETATTRVTKRFVARRAAGRSCRRPARSVPGSAGCTGKACRHSLAAGVSAAGDRPGPTDPPAAPRRRRPPPPPPPPRFRHRPAQTQASRRGQPQRQHAGPGGQPADQAGPAALDPPSLDRSWRERRRHPAYSAAAGRTCPIPGSSAPARTRLRSPRTNRVSVPLNTCRSSPQARSDVPKNQSATG